jgi:hypothetical protein
LRRQTASGFAGAKPGQEQFVLPVRSANVSVGEPSGSTISAIVDRDSVAVCRPSGTTSASLRSYRGVAVRMVPTDGKLAVVLELNHPDPRLTVPISIAENPEDIAQEWRIWSQNLDLPMLLFEADGSISRPVNTLGQLEIALPKSRRMHSYFASRRPRFLARRKAGWPQRQTQLRGREIIARD